MVSFWHLNSGCLETIAKYDEHFTVIKYLLLVTITMLRLSCNRMASCGIWNKLFSHCKKEVNNVWLCFTLFIPSYL